MVGENEVNYLCPGQENGEKSAVYRKATGLVRLIHSLIKSILLL